MTDISIEIDPVLAVEILPLKIVERKKIIASMQLDLAAALDSPLREEESSRDEIEGFRKAIQAQTGYLAFYENRLAAIKKAASG